MCRSRSRSWSSEQSRCVAFLGYLAHRKQSPNVVIVEDLCCNSNVFPPICGKTAASMGEGAARTCTCCRVA